MRRTLLAAVAAAAISTPAVARDHSWYAGIEGGVMKVERLKLDYRDPVVTLSDGVSIRHKTGVDADLIGGYDFGMFRLEAETGYKHASISSVTLNPYFGVSDADAGGHTTAISAMANGLFDFGNDTGVSGYVGGGIG